MKAQSAFSRGFRSPGRKVNSESLCAPGDQTERERERERERGRERERKKDTGTRALMEQRCFNPHAVGIYTVVILSKDKD